MLIIILIMLCGTIFIPLYITNHVKNKRIKELNNDIKNRNNTIKELEHNRKLKEVFNKVYNHFKNYGYDSWKETDNYIGFRNTDSRFNCITVTTGTITIHEMLDVDVPAIKIIRRILQENNQYKEISTKLIEINFKDCKNNEDIVKLASDIIEKVKYYLSLKAQQ